MMRMVLVMRVMQVIKPISIGILWIVIQIFVYFHSCDWILGSKLDLSMDIFLHIYIAWLFTCVPNVSVVYILQNVC